MGLDCISQKMKFRDKVLELCIKIPKGKVTTYKEIAKEMNTKAYQAIGNSLKNNQYPIKIPCHRVIKSNGDLGGYAGIINNPKKQFLLKEEGIKIKNNKIELKKYLFKF